MPNQSINKITSVNINSPLVWIDMEMSGLNPDESVILEIATIITDKDLNIIEEGPNIVINHTQKILDKMDDWNKKHHGQSGLMNKVVQSSTTLKEAEAITLEFIKKYCEEKKSPLCGNTISQDRRFLNKYMPLIENYLHYRNIDVSTIKELVARWYPDYFYPPKKKALHKALNDIHESIQELIYYKENFISLAQIHS